MRLVERFQQLAQVFEQLVQVFEQLAQVFELRRFVVRAYSAMFRFSPVLVFCRAPCRTLQSR